MNIGEPISHRRRNYVIAAGVSVVIFLMVFSVMRQARRPRSTPTVEPDTTGIIVAPTNTQLAAGRRSHNRDRQAAALASLSAAVPAVITPSPHDEAAWQTERQRRSDTRAYDGAPPVIPHPIDQRGYPSCMTCHERGAKIGNLTAPAMSHQAFTSCTQCHAAVSSTVPLTGGLAHSVATETGFVGLEPAGKGTRAWNGAPPTIPHSTWMRDRCSSCHGNLSDGLHTSHAQRQSCTQCHGLSAALDQKPPLALVQTSGGAP